MNPNSSRLGTPLDICISKLKKNIDVVRITLAGIIVSHGKANSALGSFVTDPNPINRAKNMEILLDFIEAVMEGNNKVDNYLDYLRNNTNTPPQTFSEWQKTLIPSAPVVVPPTTIVTPTQPPDDLQKRPEALKQKIAQEDAALLAKMKSYQPKK